jgi:DNA-binding SARP family transcriptional activator
MNQIKFYMFGKFTFGMNGKLINTIEPRKAEELLAYLLLNRDRAHSRERLADILWREISQDQANNYLRKSLWQLQILLDHLGLNRENILSVDGDWIQIKPHFQFWLDIKAFEESFQKSKDILGRNLIEKQARMIKRAVQYYRGELLDGWYRDWCLYERERFQHQFLVMLDKLMDYCEAHQYHEEGISYGEKILQYDKAREHTHRRLMRLHYLSGNRTAALRQYRKCIEILHEELDVEPSQRTDQLFQLIRIDKLDRTQPSQESVGNKMTQTREKSLFTIFGHLNTFQKSLTKMQAQVSHDIQIIEMMLKGNQ